MGMISLVSDQVMCLCSVLSAARFCYLNKLCERARHVLKILFRNTSSETCCDSILADCSSNDFANHAKLLSYAAGIYHDLLSSSRGFWPTMANVVLIEVESCILRCCW